MMRQNLIPAAVLLSSGIVLKKLYFAAKPPEAHCRILFFSDTHFRSDLIRNSCSCSPLKRWSGLPEIGKALLRSVEEIAPDVLIFGGDLVSHTVLYPEAFQLLKEMNVPVKLAVFGNWESKTRAWLSSGKVEQGFRNAGFQLLQNRSVTVKGIQFAGLEDFRFGNPLIPEPQPEAFFRFLISHNPDIVGKTPAQKLAGYDLILSGHTHGGQIRLPLFGAVRTSSIYWKRYERGIRKSWKKPPMFISSGIGATYILRRFCCPPEMLLVEIGS